MMDREEFFLLLGIQNIVFCGLNEDSKRIFLKSLNKNPIAFLYKYPPVNKDELRDFEAFKNYFVFQPIEEDNRLYFINKADIYKSAKNLKTCFRNQFICNSYLCN